MVFGALPLGCQGELIRTSAPCFVAHSQPGGARIFLRQVVADLAEQIHSEPDI
jgi:hypothetical protein